MNNKYTLATKIVEDLLNENGRLITNLGYDATGHVIVECDSFMRMKLTGEFDRRLTSFFFCPEDDKVQAMRALFGEALFDYWSINNVDAMLAAMVANVHPEITVDIGIHFLKIGVTRPLRIFGLRDKCVCYAGDKFDTYIDHLKYIKRRAATLGKFPLGDLVEPSDQIESFIGAKGGKVAIVHVRTEETSGNAKPAEPHQYDQALALLKDSGYTLVFAGREDCPEEFNHFGVVNYANSKLASFENDWRLMKRADLGMMSASGINTFLDVMGKPYLQLNSKLHVIPPFGNAVYVPGMLRERRTGRELTFLEHLFEYDKSLHTTDLNLEAVHPSSDEIFEGAKELLELAADPAKPMTALQDKMRRIEFDPRFAQALDGLAANGGCIHHSRSRMCDSFLKGHQHLL